MQAGRRFQCSGLDATEKGQDSVGCSPFRAPPTILLMVVIEVAPTGSCYLQTGFLIQPPAGTRCDLIPGVKSCWPAGYGCMTTVTGGLPGKNNVPVLLLLGIKIPGAPPPVGATVACLPWLEVTVPVKPRGPKIGVPGRGKVEACEFGPGTVRGLARSDFDDGDRPCRE